LRERVEALIRDYDYGEHMQPGRSANYRLAERLGLVEYFLERFAIVGTPEDCRRQLAGLRAVGLENVCFNLSTVSDLDGALRLFGQQVFPALAD
jgi:alkanesulfonate monooxygenase SsuD/methylene tetrahydromethanopterin reductase-like flavin-dependent oxidoreductase (luciferase family)